MNVKKYTQEYAGLAKQFTCGNAVIDKFLHDGSALDKNRGITYVMLSDEDDYIDIVNISLHFFLKDV